MVLPDDLVVANRILSRRFPDSTPDHKLVVMVRLTRCVSIPSFHPGRTDFRFGSEAELRARYVFVSFVPKADSLNSPRIAPVLHFS